MQYKIASFWLESCLEIWPIKNELNRSIHAFIKPWQYIDLRLRPLSIYFYWGDKNMHWSHQKAYYCKLL